MNEGGFIESRVESVEDGWVQEQIWGFEDFEGERRYVMRVFVEKKGQRKEARLVYDWVCK